MVGSVDGASAHSLCSPASLPPPGVDPEGWSRAALSPSHGLDADPTTQERRDWGIQLPGLVAPAPTAPVAWPQLSPEVQRLTVAEIKPNIKTPGKATLDSELLQGPGFSAEVPRLSGVVQARLAASFLSNSLALFLSCFLVFAQLDSPCPWE